MLAHEYSTPVIPVTIIICYMYMLYVICTCALGVLSEPRESFRNPVDARESFRNPVNCSKESFWNLRGVVGSPFGTRGVLSEPS
jgi:hypothetical protein